MRSEETRIQCLRRFGDDILDLNEVVALVGRHVYLRDGREMGVGDATADALRKAILPSREAPPSPLSASASNLSLP